MRSWLGSMYITSPTSAVPDAQKNAVRLAGICPCPCPTWAMTRHELLPYRCNRPSRFSSFRDFLQLYTPTFSVSSVATAREMGLLQLLSSIFGPISCGFHKPEGVRVKSKPGRMDRPRVPVEVAEHIIDFLAWDVETLRSCVLVCRPWNSRSRYHLFYSVAVSSECHRSPEALVRLFKSYPEIPSWVHSVTVVHGSTPAANPMASQTVHDVAVIVLLPYLPHLIRWRFQGHQYFGAHCADELLVFRSTALMCLARYSCIESLQLGSLQLSGRELSRIVACFPRLQNLDCSAITPYDEAESNIQVPASQFSRKANIQQLTVSLLHLSILTLLRRTNPLHGPPLGTVGFSSQSPSRCERAGFKTSINLHGSNYIHPGEPQRPEVCARR